MQQEVRQMLQQGLSDELNSALQYTQLAGNFGNVPIKQAFINYAIDELQHAYRILGMFAEQYEEPEQIDLVLPENQDIFSILVEYLAKEEAATFYYQILQQLAPNSAAYEICQQMKDEEERHLQNIAMLYQQLKGEQNGTR